MAAESWVTHARTTCVSPSPFTHRLVLVAAPNYSPCTLGLTEMFSLFPSPPRPHPPLTHTHTPRTHSHAAHTRHTLMQVYPIMITLHCPHGLAIFDTYRPIPFSDLAMPFQCSFLSQTITWVRNPKRLWRHRSHSPSSACSSLCSRSSPPPSYRGPWPSASTSTRGWCSSASGIWWCIAPSRT